MKSKLAQKRDEFILSDIGKKLCKGSAQGQYLQNRIEKAFLEGVKIGKCLQQANSADAEGRGECKCKDSTYSYQKRCNKCGAPLI